MQIQCSSCGQLVNVNAKLSEIIKWKGGMKIQDAMPTLTPGEREMLISQTCPTCWDNYFAIDEDEEVLSE